MGGCNKAADKISCHVTIAANTDEIQQYSQPEYLEKVTNLRIDTYTVDIQEFDSLKNLINDKVNSIILLGDKESAPRLVDELILTQLIFLREIREKHSRNQFNITCEINLESNKVLAEFSGANDFIVGNTLMATLSTQISQTPELYDVFDELLCADGSEIYMKRASNYIKFKSDNEGVVLDSYTISAVVAKHEEVWIGIYGTSEKRSNQDLYSKPLVISELWDVKANKAK